MTWLKALSSVLGWSYFTIWTISFYPQLYENYRLKSVAAFSFDVTLLNTLAYICYSFFTCALYWNKDVRAKYVEFENTKKGEVPVEPSDIAFAVHGVGICLVYFIQFGIYKWGIQRLSKFYITVFVLGLITIVTLIVLSTVDVVPWLVTVISAGYMKMTAAYARCIPQVYLNYKRKSMYGYSMLVTAMDFAGGTLSILQQIVDCYVYNDDKELTGNLPKLLLAVQSLLVDTVYVFQAYIIYPNRIPIDYVKQNDVEVQNNDKEVD